MALAMHPGGDPIRVVWADDAVLIRRALVDIVTRAGVGVDFVAQADDIPSTLAAVQAHDPDVVILDIRMPPTWTDEGVQVALQLRREGYVGGILVVSTDVDPATATRLLQGCGPATGYLRKDSMADERDFVEYLERVRRGEPPLDPMVGRELMGAGAAQAVLADLGRAELAVLAKMAEGLSNKGIGRGLFIGERTVDSHVSSIFRKLGLTNEPELHRRVLAVVLYLRALGLGTPPVQ